MKSHSTFRYITHNTHFPYFEETGEEFSIIGPTNNAEG
jgi:hypothetical protein